MIGGFTVHEELLNYTYRYGESYLFNVRSSDVTEATGVVQFLVVFLSRSFGTPVVSKMG